MLRAQAKGQGADQKGRNLTGGRGIPVSVSDVDFVNHLVHLSQSVLWYYAWWFSSQQDQANGMSAKCNVLGPSMEHWAV